MIHRRICKVEGSDRFPKDCRASVFSDNHRHRCSRKAVVTEVVDGVEVGFCRMHSTKYLEAKESREEAEAMDRRARYRRGERVIDARTSLLEAVLRAEVGGLPPAVAEARAEVEAAVKDSEEHGDV